MFIFQDTASFATLDQQIVLLTKQF